MKKKFLLTLFTVICVSTSVFAVNYEDKFYSLKMSYQSDNINGEETLDDFAKNYKCNLRTLPEITTYYNRRHQFGNLIKIYTTCINDYPEAENLYNNRGNAYKMLKKYDDALADYDKAISLNPKYISPYNGKISLYILKGELDEAIAISDKIVEGKTKSHHFYCLRGQIYYLMDNYKEALNNFNLAIKYAPKQDNTSFYYRGNIHMLNGNYRLAIRDYRKCLKCYQYLIKNNILITDDILGDVYFNLGKAYIQIGENDNAYVYLICAAKYYKTCKNETMLQEVREIIIDLYGTEFYEL